MAAAYAAPNDIGSLREYVTGQSRMQQAADSTVLLHITHNHLKARFPEIRLDLHVSIPTSKLRRLCDKQLSQLSQLCSAHRAVACSTVPHAMAFQACDMSPSLLRAPR